MNPFRIDSPLMQTLSDIVDLMLLNMLTIICCIPIVTIGPAVTALCDVTYRIHRDEGRIWSHYFQAFKNNFKQALLIWLILLPIGVLVVSSVIAYSMLDIPANNVLQGLTLMMAILWAMEITWVFPLQSRFENTVRETLRNALLCSLAYLPRTVLATLMNLLPWLVLYYATNLFVKVGFIWFVLWFALAIYVNWKILDKPFKRLMGEEEELPADEASDE